MALNDEEQPIFKSIRPKLITVADAMALLPFLMATVFDDTDVSFIQNKYREYGRNVGMMELLTLYERKAKDLQPLKRALSHCCGINIEEIFTPGNSDQPQTTQELFEAFHKLQAIEQRVTNVASDLHTQVEEVQKKMFEQTEEQLVLQDKLAQVQKESQQSLTDFEQKLTQHKQNHNELNGKLVKAQEELQEEITKIRNDTSDQGTKLWQHLEKTMGKYQKAQANIGDLDIKIIESTGDLETELQSQLANQTKIQSHVKTLDAELKNQGKIQEELKAKVIEMRENLADVDKVVDDKMQLQILALHDEICALQSKLNQEKESQKNFIETQIGQTHAELDNKISEDINDVKVDVIKKQTESLNTFRDQMTADVDAKTNELKSQIPSLTPLLERNTEMENNLMQIQRDIETNNTEIGKSTEIQSEVEKLDYELKNQGKLQEDLQNKMEQVQHNLDGVEKAVDERFQQQIPGLHDEIQALETKIDQEKELQRNFVKTEIAQSQAEIDNKIVKDINDVKDDVIKQQTEFKAFQSEMAAVDTKTEELKSQIPSLTPLIDKNKQIEASVQQIRQEMDQKVEDTKSEYQIELEMKTKQLEEMRQDFDDLQSQYKRTREPLQSSILLIGGQRYINNEWVQFDSFEIYRPSNSSLNRILDCKLKVARAAHISSLLSGQQLYIAGGWNKRGRLNSMEIYDPFLQIYISDGPSMSVNRHGASAVTFRDRLLVFGGLEEETKPSSSSEVYNPHTSQWSPFINMQHTRYGHCAVELDGKVYLIGGRVDGIDYSHISPSVSILDIVSHTWSEKEMKERRAGAAAAIIDENIVVTGGGNVSSILRSCIQLDPREGEWREIGEMKEKRCDHTIVNFNGKLLVMGGDDGTKYLDTVEEYDSRMDTWHTLETTLKEPKSRLSAVVL